jgi:hypothetical protein
MSLRIRSNHPPIIHEGIYLCICVCIHMCTYIYTYICMYVYIYIGCLHGHCDRFGSYSYRYFIYLLFWFHFVFMPFWPVRMDIDFCNPHVVIFLSSKHHHHIGTYHENFIYWSFISHTFLVGGVYLYMWVDFLNALLWFYSIKYNHHYYHVVTTFTIDTLTGQYTYTSACRWDHMYMYMHI